MAKQRKASPVSDWRHLVSAGALITGVFGTLLLGAVLQADPEMPELTGRGEPRRAAAEAAVPAESREPTPASAGLTEHGETAERPRTPRMAAPITGDADLVDRAAADERRLQASGHGYTLQFAVNCEAKNVRSNLDALRDHQDFYLLTMLYQDRACFRLCWGFYDNQEQARSARDVPERLRNMTPTPKVISIAEALP
jgi:septal ring-binding cell division protein DamX